MTERPRVFLGFDAQEMIATKVAETSLRVHAAAYPNVQRLSRLALWRVYTRPTIVDVQGRLIDQISNAPMSTDHAIARFFVPWLCEYRGWALFTDGDVLFRQDIAKLFACSDDRYAVMCVQHPPLLSEGTKKDGAIQQTYARKNWSSVMLFNCGHAANRWLTLDRLNSIPGRDLHRFCWLSDDEIGALDPAWNYLVGVSAIVADPAIVHYTLGVPTIPGHEHDPYADEWRGHARTAGYRLIEPAAIEAL